MIRRPVARPSSRHLVPPVLDRVTAERVTQWVVRWHGADYEPDAIAEMLDGWPATVPLDDLVKPFATIPESQSAASLAVLVQRLWSLVERGMLLATHARGAFRSACGRLCQRGIPFEETAKGDEAALWFHFIASNEFGDPDNAGYATDLGELRLLTRLLADPERLREALLSGEFPATFHEGYVSVAASLGDRRLIRLLLDVLRRCDTAHAVASAIAAIGHLIRRSRTRGTDPAGAPDLVTDEQLVDALAGYSYSQNIEIAVATVLALESLGGERVERTLDELTGLLVDEDSMLAAHASLARYHLRLGEGCLREKLIETAQDSTAFPAWRLCAIERLSGLCDRVVVETLASLLDDPTVERVRVDGYLTDDVVYSIREAAFIALMDCPFRYLVEVLGEGILARLESFEMYSPPAWAPAGETEDGELEPMGGL